MTYLGAIISAFLLAIVRYMPAQSLEPIPDRLVVLTFDDSVKSHFTVARPLLKRYKFGASFFITEGFTFKTNKKDYMTWEEIRQLHADGFEIGNHTLDHAIVSLQTVRDLEGQLRGIDLDCRKVKIPQPTSFAWPGRTPTKEEAQRALPILQQHGIRFARRSGMPEHPYKHGKGVAYEPGRDHPLLIPTTGDARPDWNMEDFVAAVKQARAGRIAVLQFHGVPEGEHPWVHTPRDCFEKYMKYLHENNYKVIALQDLARYVDPEKMVPEDPWKVIRERQKRIAEEKKP